MAYASLSRFTQTIKVFNFLILFSVFAISHAFAQEAVWGQFLDGEYGGVTMESIATPTGEVLLSGYYTGELTVGNQVLVPKYENTGSYLIKLANDGSVISVLPVEGRSVYIENASIDSNGDIVVAGRFWESIEFDGQEYADQSESTSFKSSFVAKYSQDGTAHWLKIFPNSGYTTLTLDENDDIYVLSHEMMDYYSTSSHLRKFNPNGQLVFDNEFLLESEARSYPRCMDVRNGEVLVGGMVDGNGTIFDSLTFTGGGTGFYLALFNSDGSPKWTKKIGETTYNNYDISEVMFEDDGSFYIAGGLSDNIFFARYDAQGSLQWSKKSLPQSFSASYIGKGVDGSIFLATNFYDKAEVDGHTLIATPDSHTVLNAPNVALIKFDDAGNVLGIEQFQPHIVNIVTSISISPFNEVFISGFSDAPVIKVGIVNITSPNDNQENAGDGYVIKFDGESLGVPGFEIFANEVCVKESIAFNTAFNTNEIRNITWDFGDPVSGNQNSSTQKTPTHTYTSPGLYKVRAAITDTSDKNWYSSLIFEVHAPPQVLLGSDFVLCEGQISRLEAGSGNGRSYAWQDGSTNPYFDISAAGEYWVTVTDLYCTEVDTVLVSTGVVPEISIADKSLCPGQIYPVDLTAVEGSILWNDGHISKSRNIDVAGAYTVTATNECGSGADSFTVDKIAPLSISIEDGTICRGNRYIVDLTNVPAALTWSTGGSETSKEFFDPGVFTVQAVNSCETKSSTFSVQVIEPFEFDLGKDRYVCNQSPPIILQVSIPDAQYRWSNGSTATAITVAEPGTYWLEVTNNCHSVRDTIEIQDHFEGTFPNVITPNGDPRNEYFTIDERMTGSTLLVFNRWGKQVYATDNYKNDWNADNLEGSVYYYTLPEFCIKGWVHVLR